MASAAEQIDPVCGRAVDRHEAAATIRHHDITYFFDSLECFEAFKRDPERYSRAPENGP